MSALREGREAWRRAILSLRRGTTSSGVKEAGEPAGREARWALCFEDPENRLGVNVCKPGNMKSRGINAQPRESEYSVRRPKRKSWVATFWTRPSMT